MVAPTNWLHLQTGCTHKLVTLTNRLHLSTSFTNKVVAPTTWLHLSTNWLHLQTGCTYQLLLSTGCVYTYLWHLPTGCMPIPWVVAQCKGTSKEETCGIWFYVCQVLFIRLKLISNSAKKEQRDSVRGFFRRDATHKNLSIIEDQREPIRNWRRSEYLRWLINSWNPK